jgi:hypothetical protein
LWLRSYLLNTKTLKKSAIKFVLWWNLSNKTGQNSFLPFFPYNPKAKLTLEVLFKKFYPRINRTTLFQLNCPFEDGKPFSSHENNRFLTKSQKKKLQGGAPLSWHPYLVFQYSEYFVLFLNIKIPYKSAVRFVPLT